MVSIIFLGVLGLLFLLLIILTLVLIFTKKKDTDEDYDEDYDTASFAENEASYEDYDDGDSEDINEYDEAQTENDDDSYSDNVDDEDDIFNEAYKEASDDETVSDIDDETDDGIDESAAEETSKSDSNAEDNKSTYSEDADKKTDISSEVLANEANDEIDLDSLLDEISENKNEADVHPAAETLTDEEDRDSAEEQSILEEEADVEQTVDEIPAVFADELGDYSDSAFAPVYEDDKLSDEALIASVKEAQALSENVMHSNSNNSEVLFGVGDELDKYKKKAPKKSTVSSDEDFYWYNKMDVMEKPSYKTAEMYYHYFNLPKDCIDDLLIEMYDCALVRTEEIRYIAYGIKPKAVSLKDIMQEGNYYYTDQPKQKEPLPQDLIRIYEKWCGYVDKLFDKIEIHADEYTIQEIRKILCEYGRNDVDVLLEGR